MKNYAREIMELHTLGVDAGYTQKDVQEVARCFTGWTIDRRDRAFHLRRDSSRQRPEDGARPSNSGQRQNEGRRWSWTSWRRIRPRPSISPGSSASASVSDEPSPELVNKIATVFTQTKGDLRAVTGAILTSPEFLDPKNYANKIKSPFEFVVSAVRASGSEYNEVADFSSAKSGRKKAESAALLGKGTAADTYANGKAQSLARHVSAAGSAALRAPRRPATRRSPRCG